MSGTETVLGFGLGLLGIDLFGNNQKSLPAPPSLLGGPEAPIISEASDVIQDEVVDSEAARRRASNRAADQKEKDIILGTSQESKTAVNLTQSLLGE